METLLENNRSWGTTAPGEQLLLSGAAGAGCSGMFQTWLQLPGNSRAPTRTSSGELEGGQTLTLHPVLAPAPAPAEPGTAHGAGTLRREQRLLSQGCAGAPDLVRMETTRHSSIDRV